MPADDADLVDPLSGTVIRGGLLTAIVSARPEESAAVADRLGRHGPGPHQTTWGGTRLDDLSIADVRRHIVVSEPDPRLFTGVLRDQLVGAAAARRCDATAGSRRRRACDRALDTASALDVLDALPDGLDGTVEERGRSYSGGQRQRLALARALLTEAPVLVLVEPTSAVDAHTEARIAERLAGAPPRPHHRGHDGQPAAARGRPTRSSCSRTACATASGTHRELLDHPAYRHVVLRGEEDDR